MAGIYNVTGEYLATMGIPIKAGRALSTADQDTAVAVASEDLARRFWPNQPTEQVLGKRVHLPDETLPRTIVGIVGTIRTSESNDHASPQLYLPAGSTSGPIHIFVVRTRGDPLTIVAPVRTRIAEVDPTLPVWRIATMEARVVSTFAARQSRTALLSLFAALAVCLSALGTYAVMAYSVALRTREIGIRQAFGAGPRDITSLVLRQGLQQTGLGVGIGLVLAAALSQLISGFLYQVQGFDIAVYATVAACMTAVALGACLVPLQRALRVDPARALRDE